MSDVLKTMAAKGFMPLAGSRYGAIGVKDVRSSAKETHAGQRWFYSGTFMPDKTHITIAASTEAQANEYIKKGLKPVDAAL